MRPLFFAVIGFLALAGSALADKKATIRTTAGDIVVELYPDKSPVTVENFVGLVTGKKEWNDPRNPKKKWKNKPIYNGTIFHRVVPGFMIQGGDPTGTGNGGPGYRFQNESNPSLVFDKAGVLAMANAGLNTNGCQFFITVAPQMRLNGNYTIFGQVTSGLDVVIKIATAERGPGDRPKKPVVIKSIKSE